MKTILHLVMGLIIFGSVSAQSYTLNWGSSFAPAWADGATAGNAFNIGGSGINCSVNIAKSGGVFASSSGISAPTVTYSLVTVPGSSKNMMVALDYSNPGQHTDITFTFSAVVYDLSFNLADIDRLTNTSNSYYDQIKITGYIGATTVLPTISKYDATTDPNFLSIAGNVAQVNTASGMAGNTASDATDQRGTIKVNFGGKTITSFTIRYENASGVASDPGLQFVGIGNINFFTAWPLAVQLVSFEGKNDAGKNSLNWKTAKESDMAYYAVERSETGKDFSEIGRVSSLNLTAGTEYSFEDKTISSNNYYYRLKMVNSDGGFTYSKIVMIANNDLTEAKVFPAVFTSSLTLRMSSSKMESAQVKMIDLSGRIVYQHVFEKKQGVNEFSLQLPSNLPCGQYFVVLGNRSQSIGVMKQ